MRDRLIELICESIKTDECVSHCNYPYCHECKNLADNLIANGIIAPPCKVWDTVYYINRYNHIMLYKHEVYEAKVVRLVVTGYGVSPVIRVKSVYSTYEIPGVEFGKNVFLTREEAEQALEKHKGE